MPEELCLLEHKMSVVGIEHKCMKISVSEENSEKKKENREKSKAYHSKF